MTTDPLTVRQEIRPRRRRKRATRASWSHLGGRELAVFRTAAGPHYVRANGLDRCIVSTVELRSTVLAKIRTARRQQ